MMKKRRYYLGLLALPLLMANSPMPYPHYQEYDDIESTITELPSYSEVTRRYSLEVKNVGNKHLYVYKGDGNFDFGAIDQDDYLVNAFTADMTDKVFKSQTLKPGQTATFITYNELDLDKTVRVKTHAFEIIDESITYSTPTVEKDKEGDNRYVVKTKFSKLGDYYYAIAVDAKYDGKDYSFVMTDSKIFKTEEEIDLDKLSIENMTFYRSSYNTYKGGYVLYGIIKAAEWAPYILLGLFVLALIVPPAIIIPIKVSKAKRRRKRALEESQK